MKLQGPISVVLVLSLSTIIFAQAVRPNIGDKAKVVLMTGDTVAGTIAFIADTSIRLKTAFGEMNFTRAECRTLILEKPPEPAISAPVPAPAAEPAPASQAAPALPVVAEKKVITLRNGDKLEGDNVLGSMLNVMCLKNTVDTYEWFTSGNGVWTDAN